VGIQEPTSKRLLRGLVIVAFVAAPVYLFFGDPRVHLLAYWPFLFLFLLACPLLHMTTPGGHGGHGGHSGHAVAPDKAPNQHES
jgi:hypothetical protein